jgi:hypothetical protein
MLRLGEAWKSMNLRPPLREVPRAQRRFEQSGRRGTGADAAPDGSTDAACEAIREQAYRRYADKLGFSIRASRVASVASQPSSYMIFSTSRWKRLVMSSAVLVNPWLRGNAE